ncbi:uncharacterized protein LOC134208054 isoform X2 [Armigeres subalbatus]|uniref:uncharacterized protein LOC134208054 isoform X2 n=1 Tax=Armigeres subalbatus TaxID=124917 RepID=UPI002ECFC75B
MAYVYLVAHREKHRIRKCVPIDRARVLQEEYTNIAAIQQITIQQFLSKDTRSRNIEQFNGQKLTDTITTILLPECLIETFNSSKRHAYRQAGINISWPAHTP